ncbi:MAG: hypothetical protein KF820_03395 [Candidatus Paracaedibacteraceae bacterium]|nr:hypothetical protein [Candidatus Paracaedibacteraceae bacterium]
MTKHIFAFIRTFIVSSVLSFFLGASALIACAYFQVIDFYHQLDPMLITFILISTLVGMIQAVRSISYDSDLNMPVGAEFVPVRNLPSNMSRRPRGGSL